MRASGTQVRDRVPLFEGSRDSFSHFFSNPPSAISCIVSTGSESSTPTKNAKHKESTDDLQRDRQTKR
jgi:hypothetical protein